MSAFKFYRGTFGQLWLELRSNESLGILDTDFIEDYNGNDGQVSLFHVSSGTRYAVPMADVPSETPDIPNDFFRGAYDLNLLPNGIFQVQGRVRDEVGNYSILSAVANPYGNERILKLELEILDGHARRHAVTAGPLTVRAATVVPKRVARKEVMIELGSK